MRLRSEPYREWCDHIWYYFHDAGSTPSALLPFYQALDYYVLLASREWWYPVPRLYGEDSQRLARLMRRGDP